MTFVGYFELKLLQTSCYMEAKRAHVQVLSYVSDTDVFFFFPAVFMQIWLIYQRDVTETVFSAGTHGNSQILTQILDAYLNIKVCMFVCFLRVSTLLLPVSMFSFVMLA